MQTIIALDYSSKQEVTRLLERLGKQRLFVKVGMELFFACGLDIVKYLKDLGHQVFLDLKLNDISNTVARGVVNLSKLEADILSIHSLGGNASMRACAQALSECAHKPKLFGISVLTSFDRADLRDIGIDMDITEYMVRRALAMRECGFAGSVCSVWESMHIKRAVNGGGVGVGGGVGGAGIQTSASSGAGAVNGRANEISLDGAFETICPGIRVFSAPNDQKRVATYKDALDNGADYVVIGREITKSQDPRKAYEDILSHASTLGGASTQTSASNARTNEISLDSTSTQPSANNPQNTQTSASK